MSEYGNTLELDIAAEPGVPLVESLPPEIPAIPKAHFLFLSSCPEPWGGSEELWAGAAQRLCRNGHRVSACKTLAVSGHPRIAQLQASGIQVKDYWGVSRGKLLLGLLPFLFRRGLSQSPIRRRKASGKAGLPANAPLSGAAYWRQSLLGFYQHMFRQRLRALAPDLAVISQGENFDGLHYADACRKSGIPYVLICQKASTLNWPPDALREEMRRAYEEARRVYFVSEHNRALTERQIAAALADAEVVRNPYLTETTSALPYPETASGVFRLACVARLYILEKGQDSLLEVLAQKKWKQRPLEVNFYGQGIHRQALERAAEMMELRNVSFCGFVPDITAVWREHHALVLPSRAEGLPLALVEAMMCGRPGIVTNAGGNAEVIEEGKTGFLAAGMDAASLDDVLERAWNRRSEWKDIGLQAAVSIRQLVPADPCGSFTTKLVHLMRQIRDEHSNVSA